MILIFSRLFSHQRVMSYMMNLKMDQVLLNWKHILSTSVQKSCCFQYLSLNQQTHLLKNMSQGCKGQFTNMYSFIFSFLCKIKLLVTPFQLLVSIYLQHKVVDKVVEYYSGYCFCSEKKIIKTPPHLPLPKDMIVVQVGIVGNKKHQLTCMFLRACLPCLSCLLFVMGKYH